MNDTNQSKIWTTTKTLTVAAVVTGFVLLIYFNFHAAAQLKREQERFKSIEHFVELQQRQERVASEIELMRSQLRTMYYTCRSAEDFFGVFDHEIAYFTNSYHWNSLQTLITVPQAGSHQMRVLVTQESPGTKETVLCQKTIPLEPGQTSEIQLECDWREKENKIPRNVKLKVNQDEIELPIPRFLITSTGRRTSGDHRFFRQPNQKMFYLDKESHNKIVDFNFGGKGENENIHIQIFVDSDGPLRSAADDAKTVRELIGRLHMNDADEKVQYDSQGWYTFE